MEEMEDNILMELGVELCPMCIYTLKNWLKDDITGQVYLPCIRSSSMCKNYYQCTHQTKKFRTDLQCIRYKRSQIDGLTTIKFTNAGRRRFLAEMREIDAIKLNTK